MTQWILTSSVLILLVISVRRLFKNKMKAKYGYALWLIVLVRLLCPVNFGELSFNLLSLAEESKEQVHEHLDVQVKEQEERQYHQEDVQWDSEMDKSVSFVYQTEPEADKASVLFPIEEAEKPVDSVDASLSVEENTGEEKATKAISLAEVDWQKVLTITWVIGMAVMALVIVNVNISFSTTLGMLRKEIPDFSKMGRGKKALSVYVADGINSSCLFGVIRPSIYLNKKGMNEQEKKYCVEHEYSHYLQGDMVWVLCRTVCLILHWYNPLVWLAVVLSKKDAELACDERTIERLGEEERFSYGHTLVELAAGQSKAVQVLGVATLMASDKKEVVERVKAIAMKKQTKLITGIVVSMLIVGIGLFVFTGANNKEQQTNPTEALAAQTAPTGTLTPAPTVTLTPVPTATPVPRVLSADGVVYEALTFTDHISLASDSEKGWMVDFNGDGSEELLYIDGANVYLNGELQQTSEGRVAEYWLLDIDTTDGMYELLNGAGDIYIYDGNALIRRAGIEERIYTEIHTYINGEEVLLSKEEKQHYLLDESGIFLQDADGDVYVRLLADLGEFTRIDEHTVSFEDIFNIKTSFKANAHYVLDENHCLQVVPKEYDIDTMDPDGRDDRLWGPLCEITEPLYKLYETRDLSSNYTVIPNEMLLDAEMTKSDCVEWGYIERPHGVKGWLYLDDIKFKNIDDQIKEEIE